MNSLLRCLLVCAMAACVLGHAVMRVPVPLNPNPTTSQPCGVSTYPTTPQPGATWAVGSTQTIQWQLIATDGGTTVSGAFDETGVGATSTSFTTPAWTTPFQMNNGLTTYEYTFTVPAGVKCTASNGLCLFRMYTDRSWNSCLYVNITNCPTCPVPTPHPPVCTPTTGDTISFCNSIGDRDVYIAADANPQVVDVETQAAFWSSINNVNVFANGNSTTCRNDYLTYMCALNLPPCLGNGETVAVGSACHSMCETAMTACQLTTIHAALYNCSALPLCLGEKVGAAASVAFSAALLAAMAVVALFL